ncbi:MAG TPA: hypothetical protein DEF89_11535 [Desulfosporosinus sp.]|nr:hypothetical protein [Desulfosporosinus sp.]
MELEKDLFGICPYTTAQKVLSGKWSVYIKRLREKIEDDSQNPSIIKTVRGIGYKGGS